MLNAAETQDAVEAQDAAETEAVKAVVEPAKAADVGVEGITEVVEIAAEEVTEVVKEAVKSGLTGEKAEIMMEAVEVEDIA